MRQMLVAVSAAFALLGAVPSASGQSETSEISVENPGYSPQYSLLGCKWIVTQLRVSIPTPLTYYATLKTGADRWTNANVKPNYLVNSGLIGNYTSAQRNGLAAHEFGHALGLDHNNSRIDVLMYGNDGRTVGIPQADDRNGVNAMYP